MFRNKTSPITKTVELSVDRLKLQSVNDILDSIKLHGLRSMSSIPTSSKAIPTGSLQTQNIFKNICVNYVNLNGLNQEKRRTALETVVFEEYCGIYGIILERQWPFQRFQDKAMRHTEIEERLMSSMVFVLAPPKLNPLKIVLNKGLSAPDIAFYHLESILTGDIKNDSFSQSVGRNVLTNQNVAFQTDRVTEIKTIHSFAENEILAILVPEEFVDRVKQKFINTVIIPVHTSRQTLQCIPEMLSLFQNESLSESVEVNAPDFYSALYQFTKDNKIEKFSTHALRMPTTFDYIARPIFDIEKNKDLISKTKGQVIEQFEDGNSWVSFHKSFGQSKEPVIKRVKENSKLVSIVDAFEAEAILQIELCKQLSNAKPRDSMFTYVYQQLQPQQLRILMREGVQVLKHKHYFAIHYASSKKEAVNQIISKFDFIQKDAATKIQATYKGFWTRKVINDYNVKTEELLKAQHEPNKACVSSEPRLG